MFSRFLNEVDEKVKTCCMSKHYYSVIFGVFKDGIKSLRNKKDEDELE